jgi:hypothetical protein
VSPSFVADLTVLGGAIETNRSGNSYGIKYFGDGSYKVQRATTRAQTTGALVGASVTGQNGVGGYTHTSAKTVNDSGCIAVKGVALNDNTSITTGVWGGYLEVVRDAGAGNGLGLEVAIVNKGDTGEFTPDMLVSSVNGSFTASYWGSSGIAEADDTDASIAMGFIGQPSSSVSDAKYNRGIVFQQGSVRTGEILCMSATEQVTWYDTRTGGNGKLSYISGANTSSNRGRVAIGTRNLSSQDFNEYTFDRVSFSYSITNSVDLGSSTLRFKSLYLQNSPDVVSDENKKTSKRSLSTDEINAGLELARNIQMFKWISEVAEKGEPSAYYHTSVMAQEAWQILIDKGLEPTEYGFISNQTDNWSVMPTELSMLMSAALVMKQDELEARLAALEAL